MTEIENVIVEQLTNEFNKALEYYKNIKHTHMYLASFGSIILAPKPNFDISYVFWMHHSKKENYSWKYVFIDINETELWINGKNIHRYNDEEKQILTDFYKNKYHNLTYTDIPVQTLTDFYKNKHHNLTYTGIPVQTGYNMYRETPPPKMLKMFSNWKRFELNLYNCRFNSRKLTAQIDGDFYKDCLKSVINAKSRIDKFVLDYHKIIHNIDTIYSELSYIIDTSEYFQKNILTSKDNKKIFDVYSAVFSKDNICKIKTDYVLMQKQYAVILKKIEKTVNNSRYVRPTTRTFRIGVLGINIYSLENFLYISSKTDLPLYIGILYIMQTNKVRQFFKELDSICIKIRIIAAD